MRAAAAVCLLLFVAATLAAPAAPRRHLAAATTSDIAADSGELPPPAPPSAPPAPPPAPGATHRLTVQVEYQLDGADESHKRIVAALVTQALSQLSAAVHLPGAAPAPLLLPRACGVVQEWRRDGKVVSSECIEPVPVGDCLQATHNRSYFGSLNVCSGRRAGECATEPAGGAPLAADLVLYVTSRDGGITACSDAAHESAATRTSAGTTAVLAAAGGACEVDDVTGRPVAGAINLCPARLAQLADVQSADAQSADTLRIDIQHELLHVLAFSEGLYRSFPNNGSAIAPAAPGGGLLVSSPAVLDVARRHFNCPTLRGVPLEDEGGAGTARTHWKLRVLNGELMVGTVITGQRPVLSNFTLAFLGDTSWYAPQYDAAAPLAWGAQAGCEFVTAKTCADITNSSFFCAAPARLNSSTPDVACTLDGTAVGACSPLPLTQPSERCYALMPFSNWQCRDARLESDDRALWGYAFKPGARCVLGGSTPWSRTDSRGRMQFTQEAAVPGCFDVRCNSSGTLVVRIDDVDIPCPAGASVSLADIKGLRFKAGSLGPCPEASRVCLTCPGDCNGTGECMQNGQCRCWPGFDGADCSTLAP